ncbi:hypothetical protein FRC11_004432 [Ceratobasidium sp. 423]|nr:hypothetical protein FRC11_004432 [Ceratobasidium sp. 423]
MTSSIGHPVPKQPSRLGETNPATSTIDRHNLHSLGWSSGISTSRQYTDLRSHITIPHEQPATLVEDIPTFSIGKGHIRVLSTPIPPVQDGVGIQALRTRPSGPMTMGQASLIDSIFSLAGGPPEPILSHTPDNYGPSPVCGPGTDMEQNTRMERRQSLGPHPQTEPTANQPGDTADTDPENLLVGLLSELVLDREVQSNMIPFVAYSFTSWMSRFLFEPTRVISCARDIIRSHSFGGEPLQRMMLVADTVSAVSKSTDYELTSLTTLYKQVVNRTLEARACSELTREEAMEAMDYCDVLICLTCKMGSLAGILNILDLCAPVFRRACPELDNELVNLPQRLTSIEVNLKYFATFDVLQGVLTHRPMLFRYDLNFLSPRHEELLNADDGPGLRWLIGVPDRLVFIFAKMNTLLEDFENCMDSDLEMVKELERDIEACEPVISSDTGEDPALKVGRVVVQQSWQLAGYVYLYMGLCGANSLDERVVKVQKQFMRLLENIKSSRNPDSFLVFPMVLLGIATSSSKDQSTLLARLWGVPECNKPGTTGNDVVRILNDIWGRTVKRSAVWSDLRVACLRVTGM